MSGSILTPNFIGLVRGLTEVLLGIIKAICYALSSVIQPFAGLGDWFVSPGVVVFVTYLIAVLLIVLWAALINLLTIMWVERKLYARIQDRRGIMIAVPVFWSKKQKRGLTHLGWGFLQNVADGVKLLQKENVTPAAADKWMFHAAPAIMVSSSLMAFAVLPFSESFYYARVGLGILFILASLSLAPFAILLAGYSSNNKYSLLGGLRGAAQMMSYEIPMILCVIAVVILTGTLDPVAMVQAQERPLLGPVPAWSIFSPPQILGFVIFFIAIFAELERIPFDVPEADAELVEGWTTEYGGMRFGLLFGFKWLRGIAAAGLVTILYFGGWSGPVFATVHVAGYPIPILPQEFWFLLKLYVIFMVIIWIAWSIPRVRIDQVLKIGWNRLIPLSLLTILGAAVFKTMGWF